MFSHLGIFEILLLTGIPCAILLILGGIIALVVILNRKNRKR